MHLYARWTGALALCLLSSGLAVAQAGPLDMLQALDCRHVRDKLNGHPKAHVLAAQRPELQPLEKPVWMLRLRGVEVPVLVAGYDQVHLKVIEDDIVVVLVSRKERLMQSWSTMANPRLEGEEVLPVRPDARPFDWFVSGVMHAPDDVACSRQEKVRDGEKLAGILYKLMMLPGAVDVAYRGQGAQPAVSTLGFVKRNVWQHAWYGVEDQERILQLTYVTDVAQARPPVVLAIGEPALFDIRESPRWLQQLETAYASGAMSDWRQFFSEARKAGFDEEALRRGERAMLASDMTKTTEAGDE